MAGFTSRISGNMCGRFTFCSRVVMTARTTCSDACVVKRRTCKCCG
jgi:hypothetical protein